MTFKNLHSDTECNCIDNTFEDLKNEYIRKLRKDKLTDADFLSHWERGIGKNEKDCEKIIKLKGISINKNSQKEEQLIINRYKTTFKINPKKGSYLLKFKFKKDAGQVAETGRKGNESHHDFYKSDKFDLNKLDKLLIVKFA